MKTAWPHSADEGMLVKSGKQTQGLMPAPFHCDRLVPNECTSGEHAMEMTHTHAKRMLANARHAHHPHPHKITTARAARKSPRTVKHPTHNKLHVRTY